ncbi:MAG: glycosyltransferase family 9 protein [Fusobacteriaceae bacterium]|nr:glycosyltransferase family 9 protein [Fusobacteriaceae bacterium]
MRNIKYFIFEKLALLQNKDKNKVHLKKEDIKSILLIRQDNRIGNILFITSLINLIEEELHIKPDVILGEKFNDILKNNPKINNILIYSQKKFLKNPILFFKFIKNIKRCHYDLVIDCKNVFSFNNALLTLFSNSQLKIGFKNLYSDKYLDYAVEVNDFQNLHETEYLALAFKNYFNIDRKVPKMSYYLNENIEKPILDEEKKKIGIHIGGRGSKSLNVDLINNILSKFKEFDIKIIYGPDELEKVKLLKDNKNVEKIFPNSIDSLASLINSLDIFITPDTGPLHIASALNKNIIALFAGDDFHRYGPRTEKNTLCLNFSKSNEEILNKINDFILKI